MAVGHKKLQLLVVQDFEDTVFLLISKEKLSPPLKIPSMCSQVSVHLIEEDFQFQC